MVGIKEKKKKKKERNRAFNVKSYRSSISQGLLKSKDGATVTVSEYVCLAVCTI